LDAWRANGTLRRRAFLSQLRAEILAFAGDISGAFEAVRAAEADGLFDVAWLERCPLFHEVCNVPGAGDLRLRIDERARSCVAAFCSATS
jgi:serine/threonine-protein kinase